MGPVVGDATTRQTEAFEMDLPTTAAIFGFEMARAFRTSVQTFLAPTLSAPLFVILFSAATGSAGWSGNGVNYGAFVVPGVLILMVLTQSVSDAAFGGSVTRCRAEAITARQNAASSRCIAASIAPKSADLPKPAVIRCVQVARDDQIRPSLSSSRVRFRVDSKALL